LLHNVLGSLLSGLANCVFVTLGPLWCA